MNNRTNNNNRISENGIRFKSSSLSPSKESDQPSLQDQYNQSLLQEQQRILIEQKINKSIQEKYYLNLLKFYTYEQLLKSVNEEFVHYYHGLLDLFLVLENQIQFHPLSTQSPPDLKLQLYLIVINNQKTEIQNVLNRLYYKQQEITDRIFNINLLLIQTLHNMTL